MLGVVFLSACTTPTLKRQSSYNIGSEVQVNGNTYILSETGHDKSVYYQYDREDTGNIKALDIHIPIIYKENIEAVPENLPTALAQEWEQIKDSVGGNGNLIKNGSGSTPLGKQEVVLSVKWNNYWYSYYKPTFSSVSGFIVGVLLSPIAVPFGILGGGTTFFEDNASWELVAPEDFVSFSKKNLGISTQIAYYPKKLHLSCEEQKCVVLDEKNQPVNKVYIYKRLKVDQNKISQMLKEEEAERIRKEKEQRIFEAKQKKECPGLYQMMLYIQRYGTRVPEVAIKTSRRFEELNCGYYINQQLNQYYY